MIKILVINTVRFKLNGISAVIKNYYRAMDRENIKMDFLAIDDPSKEYQAFFEENIQEIKAEENENLECLKSRK